MSLFRPEVTASQRRRLYGGVTLHQPVAFSVFAGVIVATTVVAMIFLAVASFARKETVRGSILPEAGFSEIVSPRSGVASEVLTEVGRDVPKGAPLIAVATEVNGTFGELGELQKEQTRVRIAELDIQARTQAQKAGFEQSRLLQRADAADEEVVGLENSLKYQREQLALAERQHQRIGPLVSSGYVSAIEGDRRAQMVLAQRQAIEDLERSIATRRADARDFRAQAASITAQLTGELSQIRSSRSLLQQNVDELDAQGRLIIRAPISGTVTAINVNVGGPVASGVELMTLASIQSPLRAEIFIPTRAAGFVEEGQTVRLMVDAFPYQRFGTVEGTITKIHRSPVTLRSSVEGAAPPQAYRAYVHLKRTSLFAYKGYHSIKPGMDISADIETSRQTLLQMLIDPVLSLRNFRGQQS
jgi:membrane fusion protein